jgi:hypothetical protein
MTIKYAKVFHSKAFKNKPKIGIFGLQMRRLATLQVAASSAYLNVRLF